MIRSPYATRMTLYGVRNMDNNKPYRTPRQRAIARDRAEMRRGTHVCPVNTPRSYHKGTEYKPSKQELRHFERYLEAVAVGK